MRTRADVSAYLLSSLKEYFGEEKGERIAGILSKSGVRCFDDLASGVPDSLIELMEISKSSFIGFLEEYGPQAIAKLKEKVGEMEAQLSWARDKIRQEVDSRTSISSSLMREVEIVLSMLSTLVTSIQLCCGEGDAVDDARAELYSGTIREAAERLRKSAGDDDISEQIRGLAQSLERIAELTHKIRYSELKELLEYAISLLSDLRRSRAAAEIDKDSLLRENVILKSKIISLLCWKDKF